MPNQLFKASGRLDVPDPDRVVITRREEPLRFDTSIVFFLLEGLHAEDPRPVAFEGLSRSAQQIVSPYHWVTACDKEPLIKQMKALDGVLSRNECSIDLSCFQINSSDLFVPAACEQKVVLFMNTTVEHRIGKLIDLQALVRIDVPLPDCAVLGRTKQTFVFKSQMVDLVRVA